MRFTLKLDKEQILALEMQYKEMEPYERNMGREDAAFEAGKRICAGQYTLENLEPIVIWKAERAKGHIRKNQPVEIIDVLSAALRLGLIFFLSCPAS